MNCLLRNTRSLFSQIVLRSKAASTPQRFIMQDLGLIRGSAHTKPVLLRPQPTSSFVLRWYHDPRKVAAATAITLSAMVMAYRGRYDREIIPCTYRSHLVVLSHQEERKLADSAFIEEKAKFEMVDPSDPRSVRVRLIVERIVHAAHRGLGIYDSNDAPMLRVTEKRRPKWGKAQPHTDHLRGLNWEVFLAKDDYRDARITPSGKIIVSTGLLDQSTSDEEIAAVLAHEVGHVIARHVADISRSRWPTFLQDFFSRRMEIEADYIGILLLAAAGIHPHWALVAMEKRARLERGSALRYILSNHPNPKKQLQLLSKDKTMKEAMELYREVTAMDKVTDRYFR